MSRIPAHARAVPAFRAGDRAWRRLGAVAVRRALLALGAFFAGMIMSELELSHQAAEEYAAARRLRGAVLRLGRHAVRPDQPGRQFLADPRHVLAIIVLGRSIAAFLIVVAFGYPAGTGLMISASLAQIGVLLHPRRTRSRAEPAAGRGTRPDPAGADPSIRSIRWPWRCGQDQAAASTAGRLGEQPTAGLPGEASAKRW